MGCHWDSAKRARIVPRRHEQGCEAPEDCPGCERCSDRHCGTCGRAHADVTCAECLAETRDHLHTIAAMCDALPAEVGHRGVNGEAMMLLGPSADPEAWRNRAMSAMRGRLDATYLDDCRDEMHPTWVLGTWEQVWRDHLDQPTDLRATLPRLVDYLDRQMHVMAEVEEIPFEDFARDLRGCRSHLEGVLHDQNQGDAANVGCFECGATIERRLTDAGFEDHWTCTRCRRRYTYAEYNFALRAELEAAREESA